MFDRSTMTYYPLSKRINKVNIVDAVIDGESFDPDEALMARTDVIADEIVSARKRDASVVLAYGAHTTKNGLGRLLAEMAEAGWITHLATNGAGIIHDWEFAYQGESSEDVRANIAEGKFGTWEETGLFINLALAAGAWEGLGYGASIGKMICTNGLEIPAYDVLTDTAAGLDLLSLLRSLNIDSGFLAIEHPFASYSLQARCYERGIRCTAHPMFGCDIIYTHKACSGSAIGRTAERDFLSYVDSIANLEGGVYLSIGSAVMSPMIFEKSLSMVRNSGKAVSSASIHVVDLAPESWDWSGGEPPADNPAYYLRYMKTFSRMGLSTSYLSCDNREFFVSLYQSLKRRSL